MVDLVLVLPETYTGIVTQEWNILYGLLLLNQRLPSSTDCMEMLQGFDKQVIICKSRWTTETGPKED